MPRRKTLASLLLLFCSTTLCAQTYQRAWETVDSLDRLSQPRTALDIVRSVYARARRENNTPQAIRALLYTVSVDRPLEENADSAAIRLWEGATDSFPEPARSVLLNIQAQAYANYLSHHYYLIYRRTPVAGGPGPDLATWTAQDFNHKVDSLFTASLRDTGLLASTSVSDFEPILQPGNSRALRPTLFDLLAHRALQYYAIQPGETTDTLLLSPAGVFVTHTFPEAGPFWKGVRLYQILLRLHARDARPDAFVDADLSRLDYLRSRSPFFQEPYGQTLTGLSERYKDQEAGAMATWKLAVYWQEAGWRYPYDTTVRWRLKQASDLLEDVVRRYPHSQAAGNARVNLAALHEPQLQVNAEHVIPPGKPFLASVSFKNSSNLSLRILRSTPDLAQALREGQPNALTVARALRAWNQSIPDPGDLQRHVTEIKIDALPAGPYILLVAINGHFGADTLPMVAVPFQVSSIAWVSTGADVIFVLDRQTGAPLADARIHVTSKVSDQKEDYTADKDGRFAFDRGKGAIDMRNRDIAVYHDGDSLSLSDMPPLAFVRNGGTPIVPRFSYFTDRAIYRPGQTVYFKAIGVIRDTEQGTDIPYQPHRKLTFTLKSGIQVIDSVSLQPNEFGSVHGRFTIPSQAPLSTMTISGGGTNDRKSISVEEYKRARYEVVIDRPSGDYRLGDSLNLHGRAAAYAGNPVGGARVVYTVTRTQPRPLRFVPLASPAEIILQDSARTGADGSFGIRFALRPPVDAHLETDVYVFQVYATVTDINGETHAAEYTVNAGHAAVLLTWQLPATGSVVSDSLRSLNIIAVNPAGAPVKSLITITLSRLTAPPAQLPRPISWETPDVFTIPEDTFHILFPHHAYGPVPDRDQWPVEARVLRDTVTAWTHPGVSLHGLRLPSGVYRVEATATDDKGFPVSAKTYLEVFNPSGGSLPYPAYDWQLDADSTLYAGSSAGPRYVIEHINQAGRSRIRFLRLTDTVTMLPTPPAGVSADGATVGIAFVRDNRVFTKSYTIAAREGAGRLNLHYATFRDHLEPGSAERMTLSIHGPGHEAADAEVLASMYDASLDQFVKDAWRIPAINQQYTRPIRWSTYGFDDSYGRPLQVGFKAAPNHEPVEYDEILDKASIPGNITAYGSPRIMIRGAATSDNDRYLPTVRVPDDTVETIGYFSRPPAPQPAPLVSIRQNFAETAFFYPDLRTDSAGNVSYSFTMPDALTRWTLQTLAHTRSLAFGVNHQDLVTQKTLMLQPNITRFLREGDDAWLSAKVVNMDSSTLRGAVRLEILDALTMKTVSNISRTPSQPLSLAPGAATAVRFRVTIPMGFTHPLVYRLTAKAGAFSDGEQGPIPILNRRILVTDTYPLNLDGDAPRQVDVQPLLQAAPGTPYRLTLEYSASPAWYVLRALPYIEGASDACPQFVLDRYYTKALGAGILDALPSARAALSDTGRSPLDRNPELKTALLQETPWVLDAAGENAALRRLSNFLDPDRLAHDRWDDLHSLVNLQQPSGAFPWFTGGGDNRYVTQYILTHLGRLSSLGMLPAGDRKTLDKTIRDALAWLDDQIREDYAKSIYSDEDIQYLYTRSFFPDAATDARTKAAIDYYFIQARNRWTTASLLEQGMIAIACHRDGDTATAGLILQSLAQRSLYTPDLGRYWKMDEGWYWYQAPIETQAMLLSAFAEIKKDMVFTDQLRTWLLGQKQTHGWSTSSATADACYALLLGGRDWLNAPPTLTARLGDVTVTPQASAPYVKMQWENPRPALGAITLHRTGNTTHRSWAAVYYQHFETLDTVTAAQTTLAVQKQLFVVPPTGNLLRPLHDGDTLHTGDRVRIRLVLRSDRSLDFVHLKDLRPACLEPVETLSGYHWQGGLGYYFSPADLSTSFYLDHLPRGTFVLEYDQYVNMAGAFAGGIATLQSFYA
ncbi:MAG TPA: alpha-2-macroglobulin family protein, partial [Dinghuibacter sp.]|uniref:alpha-2-macroglobulin family protein n=1 Tax=Dinghuibacter sp. TaxID=2024697 RepID=UPI002CCA9C4C